MAASIKIIRITISSSRDCNALLERTKARHDSTRWWKTARKQPLEKISLLCSLRFSLFPRGVNGSPPIISKRLFHTMGNCEFFPRNGENNAPTIPFLFHRCFHPRIPSVIRSLIALHIILVYTRYYITACSKIRAFSFIMNFFYCNHIHKIQIIYISNCLSHPHSFYF